MKLVPPLLLAGVLAMPVISTATTSAFAAMLPGPAVDAPMMQASGCSALALTVHPGLNPPLPKGSHNVVAPDAPRHALAVSLPLYPGATAATSPVASVFPEYPADPYLQTAGAEYTTPDPSNTVEAWAKHIFPACGWRQHGSWSGNGSAFTSGIVWQSVRDPRITTDISFGSTPSGGTYLGYGVEAILLPPRPARSYVHGPFSRVSIVLKRYSIVQGKAVPHANHVTVRGRSAIQQLVRAINAIKGYRTAFGVCSGGLSLAGPAWLAFVRPNGSSAHAFEVGPGVCGGGLAVNGVRWLVDEGRLWNLVIRLVPPQPGGKSSFADGSYTIHPAPRTPWTIQRVLDVGNVAALCSSHPSARFTASVRGYLTAVPLRGPGGGWVGRLSTTLNPHAFFAGNTRSFVQVWGTKAWSLGLNGRRVVFHGVLSCDAQTYSGDLPGWRGSIRPDRALVQTDQVATDMFRA